MLIWCGQALAGKQIFLYPAVIQWNPEGYQQNSPVLLLPWLQITVLALVWLPITLTSTTVVMATNNINQSTVVMASTIVVMATNKVPLLTYFC